MTREAHLGPSSGRAQTLSPRRVEAYARHPIVRRPRLRLRFAAFAGVRSTDGVLDVACGPGFNAFAFARRAREVVAVERSPELLAVAEREAKRRGLRNVSLHEGDPAPLPFPADSFDLVTTTGTVHHFDSPVEVFAEMARVSAPGGRIAIEDVVASEQEVRARYHNRLERLRDRSHRRCLPLSELLSLLGRQGLLVQRVLVQESLREFNEWISVAGTPPRRAEHIRRLLLGAQARDLSGLAIRPADDTFLFVQQVAWVLAIKPA